MKKHKGFTYIEAMVSIFLLVLLLIAVFSIFTNTRGAVQLSENHVNAAYWGSSLMNDLARGGFDNIGNSSGSFDFKGTDNGATFIQTVDYNINVVTLDTDKKQVWINLTWQEHSGNKQVVVESIFSKL